MKKFLAIFNARNREFLRDRSTLGWNIILPVVLGVAAVSVATAGAWALGYRYYRGQVEESLNQSLQLLPATARAAAATRGSREPAPGVLERRPAHRRAHGAADPAACRATSARP